ncbi:nephrocystin-4 isoform X3 [Scyliorhinus canicula]|uniref:nephrocystin-4 isoform X3 n=1 Tax=Scyliorhinus canicula TaxID=7830 RepID=UPI0018F51F94|nr:nephrocystin-4 isoform X3 [Scyliorhinus canicula]
MAAAAAAALPGSGWGARFNWGPPPHFQRYGGQVDTPEGFQLLLRILEGLPFKASLMEGVANVQCQLRLTLFDTTYSHFFGRTWKSSPQPIDRVHGQPAKVLFNQAVYFHTSLNCSHVAIIVEVVAIAKKREGNKQILSCGFGILHLYNKQKLASDAAKNQNVKRLSLYHGTPRALLHPASQDPIEKNTFMTLIEGSTILYSLSSHPPLIEVSHLIPENVLVSGTEVIPGVVAPSKQMSNVLKKPTLMKTITCYLDKLSLHLYPTLEKFEKELVELLNADRLLKKGQVSDGSTVVIQERRLHVCVHNSWCYVQKPQVVVLIPGTVQRKPASFSKSLPKKSLVLRSRIQLKELVKHQMYGIVFHLEYVFSSSTGADGKQSASASSLDKMSYMQMLRWAVWNPFLEPNTTDVTVSLHGGPSPNPSNLLVYKTPSTEMSSEEVKQVESGTITFRFSCRTDRYTGSTYEQSDESRKSSRTIGSQHSFFRRKSSDASESQHATSRSQLTTSHWLSTTSLPRKGPVQKQLGNQQEPRDGIFNMYPSGAPEPHVDEHLQELPFTQVQVPILALRTEAGGATTVISRAALAQLHAVGFPEILDDNNELATVIDSDELSRINLKREKADNLQCNEIILQFLAFSRVTAGNHQPGSVYFTFQFYRFPPVTTQQLKLMMMRNAEKGTSKSTPFILVPLNKNGTGDLIRSAVDSPGLELKYMVEPSYMKEGEQRLFMQYLATQTLQIDVWDAESLLLIGTATVELKYLLRQGRTAVQVSHELAIITTEYAPDVPMALADITKHGTVKPHGMTTVTKGKLHMRLGNVGHEPKRTAKSPLPTPQSRIISSHDGTGGFSGGSLSTQGMKRLIGHNMSRAQRMIDLDSELASVIFSRARLNSFGHQELDNDADIVRKRKLERMMAVRQLESGVDLKSKTRILAKHEERIHHERDLQIVEAYRERIKTESISNMLSHAITTQYTLYATLGNAEFFEFCLKNPYSVQHTITIECEHPELSVIVNSREWKHFKNLTKTLTPLEEDMFHVEGGVQFPQVYLRPKEIVYIPFKFQTFSANHSIAPQGPADGKLSKTNIVNQPNSAPKMIEVSFKIENQKPIAILQVNVEDQPYIIDQTFRFYHPELTFLKKSIRLPPLEALSGLTVQSPNSEFQTHVRCSDFNIICETKKVALNEPQDVFLKVACGPSPEVKKFFVIVYMDPWLAVPIQIWQFYIHSLQRIDVSCVVGELTQFSLVLRGTQTVRKVAAYTSNPEELQTVPSDVFLLPPHTVKDLHISLRPQREGDRSIYLNVVDVDFRQLLASWLICLNCQQPSICKAFEITIPVGEGKGINKRINYTNPYPNKRMYFLRTNRPDLLQYKEDSFELHGGETYHIGLRFAPGQNPGMEEILILINDQTEKNEATYCVKITYQ